LAVTENIQKVIRYLNEEWAGEEQKHREILNGYS
jgi:hypothetical protein